MLAGGAIFGPDAKRVVVSVAVTPAGTREAGDVVTVVSRARPLAKGDRLLVERRSGAVWIKLAECARAVCSGTWAEADGIQATYSLSGTFDQRQIPLTSMSWDSGRTHYSCSSAPYGWHAKLGA